MFREEPIKLTNVISLHVITENNYFEICLESNAAIPEVRDWNLWQRNCYSDYYFINFTSGVYISVSKNFIHRRNLKIISFVPSIPCLCKIDTIQWNVAVNENWPKQNKRQFVAQGQNFSITNCRRKLPAIIRGIFGIFRVITKLLFFFIRRFLEEPLKIEGPR